MLVVPVTVVPWKRGSVEVGKGVPHLNMKPLKSMAVAIINLPLNTTGNDLIELFNGFKIIGMKTKWRLGMDSINGFCELPTQEEAQAAIDKLNGITFKKRQLFFEFDTPGLFYYFGDRID